MAENNSNSNDQNNRNLFYIVGGLLVVIVVVVIIVLSSNGDDDHYTIAVNYMKSKNYDAALVELEKIKQTDEDYVDAVSKIAFIKGVQHYKKNNMEEAYQYFSRVDATDQFYAEARNYMETIDNSKTTSSGNTAPDTVYKVDTVKQTEIKTDTVVTSGTPDPKTDTFVKSISDSIDKFVKQYQPSEDVTSGYEPYKQRLEKLRNNVNKMNTAGLSSQAAELKNLTLQWMDKLLHYIQIKIDDIQNKTASRDNVFNTKRESVQLKNKIDSLLRVINK